MISFDYHRWSGSFEDCNFTALIVWILRDPIVGAVCLVDGLFFVSELGCAHVKRNPVEIVRLTIVS